MISNYLVVFDTMIPCKDWARGEENIKKENVHYLTQDLQPQENIFPLFIECKSIEKM
jgi:hypothetical protein